MNTPKPLLLCILDGWGIGDEGDFNNAIARAKTPNYDRILKTYPHSRLETSGLAVGLPEGQIGNSEVGHMTIGAGRVIFQDLPRINNAIKDGSLAQHPLLQKLILSSSAFHSDSLSCHPDSHSCHPESHSCHPERSEGSQDATRDLSASLRDDKERDDKEREDKERDEKGIKNDKRRVCHLMGLLSDGGVHSHIDQIIFIADFLAKNGVKLLLHAFLDGRDVAQKSALTYLEKCKNIEIATVSGRYYAMDRDQKWDRIKLATDAIISAQAPRFSDAILAVKKSYAENITDEFIKPCVIGEYSGIKPQDSLIFCNFRADRARQISEKLFSEVKFSQALAFTKYSEKLSENYQILFPEIEIKNSLPEVLSAFGLTQLRIAETEKYAHVTFFFSCGREKELKGEERILVKSPSVATYDLQPEMSANEVSKNLCAAIAAEKFDFIVVNYANPDMVGHSGMLDPSIKAVEAIDAQLGLLEKIILEKNGLMLISADHGNIECMQDEDHNPHTAHTTNPVPFILIGQNVADKKLNDGTLADIAPSVLALMNIAQPREMSGKSLVK